MNSIEVKSLVKDYGDFCLGPLFLDLPQGYIIGLIGENGAGKSTLLKAILGLIHPDQGKVLVLGEEMDRKTFSQFEKIGQVYDELKMVPSLNPGQVGAIGCKLYRNWNEGKYQDLLSHYKLGEKKKIKDMSRGMQMKLGLAFALARDPDLLILDEPTGGLDPMVREEFLEDLQSIIQDENKTIILSSHILSDLEKVADYIGLIHRGQVLFFDEKDALLDNYRLVHMDKLTLSALDPEACLGVKENQFGLSVLMEKSKAQHYDQVDSLSLEDLMSYRIKGMEEKQ